MMKVNQVLLSFLLVLGLTNITLQAGQAVKVIKGIGTGFATAGRIATNRATKKEEQMFMAVNAGAFLLEFIRDLTKKTKEKPADQRSYVENMCMALTGSTSLTQALIDAGKRNLNTVVDIFKDKKTAELIKTINNEIAEDLTLSEKIELLTPTQKKEVENFTAKFDKATSPVIRLLKGESSRLEAIAIEISLGVVRFINRIRTWTKGKPLDAVGTLAEEATTILGNKIKVCVNGVCQYLIKKVIEISGKTISIFVDKYGKIVDATGNVMNKFIDIHGNLVEVYIDAQGKIRDASNKLVDLALDAQGQLITATTKVVNYMTDKTGQLVDIGGKVLGQVADSVGFTPEKREQALDLLISTTDGLITGNISAMEVGRNIFSSMLPQPSEASPEISLAELEQFLHDNVIENLRKYQDDPEELAKQIERSLKNLEAQLHRRELSENTMKIISIRLKNEIDNSILREIDLSEFGKLTQKLQNAVIESWRDGYDEDFMKLSEQYYDLFPENVLIKIEEALETAFLESELNLTEEADHEALTFKISKIKETISQKNKSNATLKEAITRNASNSKELVEIYKANPTNPEIQELIIAKLADIMAQNKILDPSTPEALVTKVFEKYTEQKNAKATAILKNTVIANANNSKELIKMYNENTNNTEVQQLIIEKLADIVAQNKMLDPNISDSLETLVLRKWEEKQQQSHTDTLQKATDAKKQQEAEITQHIIPTTPTQPDKTTPSKTTPATQNGTVTDPQATDNAGQNQEEDIFHDTATTLEELLEQYQKEEAAKRAQEEQAAKEKAIELAKAEQHTATTHGL